MIYDIISLKEQPTQECYLSARSIVEKVLHSAQNQLTSSEMLKIYEKETLSSEDLQKIQLTAEQLEQSNLQVQLFKKEEKVFWTKEFLGRDFCQEISSNAITGSICYSPFKSDGSIDAKHLQEMGFHHDFVRGTSDSTYKIKGVPISMGKRLRTANIEYMLLGGYLMAIIWLLMTCLHYKHILPLLMVTGIRIISITTGWMERYSLMDIVPSFSHHKAYHSLDMVFDGILMLSIFLFITERFIISYKGKLSSPVMVGLSFLHMLFFISHIRFVQLLVRSETSTIAIDDLGKTSASDFILFCSVVLIQLGIFHFGHALFRHFKDYNASKIRLYSTYFGSIVVAVGMGYITKLDLDPIILSLFLFCYILLMDLFVDLRTRTITWVIWWGIFFAFYLAALFFNYDIKKEIQSRYTYLTEVHHETPNRYLQDLDNLKLRETVGQMVNELLVLPEGVQYDKGDLEVYITHQLQRDDIILEIFDEQGASLFEENKYEANSLLNLEAVNKDTWFDEIRNIVWLQYPMENASNIYIGVKGDEGESKAPVAFNYYRDGTAIIKGQELHQSEIDLINTSDKSTIFDGAQVYITYRPSPSKLLVSKKSFRGFIKPITLFSFLFSIIVLLIILIGLLDLLFRFLPQDWPLFIQNLESLNSKIQLSLILVILLSFVIIASITSSFLNNYLSKEKKMVTKEKLVNLSRDFEYRSLISSSPSESVEIISNYQKDLEKIHNVQMSVHLIDDQSENLDYFTRVFYTKQKESFAFTDEGINHGLSYIPIRFKGEVAGVAEIKMKSPLENNALNVFDFLGSIFNVYVFLFFIASVISIFIAQSITRPLSMLNQKLTQVKLGKNNDQITWDRDDEIGILIGNYNKMVDKLGESAEILAKNERDSAWREMAKQVAHEIKNPLTPMKLSIQYLEKAIKRDPDNAHQISKKISKTMLEQIDNLTGIAEAFGNFAELPKTSNTKVELNNILEVVHNLFRKREDMEIRLTAPIDPIYVYADKSQLVRILNNLVKNAIESIPSDRKGIIKILLDTKRDKAIIEVSDNGIGIPDEMKTKIFQPKFTTKDSGSGLGLAIAANMIESMNGRIHFKSDPGETTSFFIELDLIRQFTENTQQERVFLD